VRDLVVDNQVVSSLSKVAFKTWQGLARVPGLSNRIGTEQLLESNFTARAEIEFSTRCNLRCVYCRSSANVGSDLDFQYLDSIADVLQRRNALSVGVSGNGETTVVKDWHSHCDRMLDRGLGLAITTNLARELSDAEAATLSGFPIVRVSCDTVRPRLFKKLRRGGNLGTLLYNMAKIRSFAADRGAREPFFWWNAVVSAQTVRYLEEYVGFGLAVGVKHFCFLNLCDPPPAEDGDESVDHVTDMPLEQLRELPGLFDRVFARIRKNGGSFICSTLIDLINDKLREAGPDESTNNGSLYDDPGKSGMTRNCLDPWIYARINVDTGVKPCCITDEVMGFLNKGQGLEDILNNSKIKAYRSGILTGKLRPACRTCPNRGWTEIEKMHIKVLALVGARRVLPALQRHGILVPLLHRWRR